MSLQTPARPSLRDDRASRPTNRWTDARALLERHRQERLDQVAALTVADPSEFDLDPGVRMRALAAAQSAVADIDDALLRLDHGGYGSCDGCGTSIPDERLLAVPYAKHCVGCAAAPRGARSVRAGQR